MNNTDVIDINDLIVKIPLIDIDVKEPFKHKVSELTVSIPRDIPLKIDLTPIITVKIELLSYDIDKAVYLISPDLIRTYTDAFNELLTSVPIIEENILNISKTIIDKIESLVKEKRLRELSIKIYRLNSKLETIFVKNIPDELKSRYGVKIRIRRKISPEIRELIESRVSKEYKLTRMIKRMEIIQDDRLLDELEKMMSDFMKKLKRY